MSELGAVLGVLTGIAEAFQTTEGRFTGPEVADYLRDARDNLALNHPPPPEDNMNDTTPRFTWTPIFTAAGPQVSDDMIRAAVRGVLTTLVSRFTALDTVLTSDEVADLLDQMVAELDRE